MCVEANEFEFNSGFKELWEDRKIDIYYCVTLFFFFFFFARDGSIFPAGAQMSDDYMSPLNK